MFSNFPPIYMIPPVLSFIVGITLAIVSIARGKLKSENILFTLICIWWTLLSPVFISHHLLTDEAQIIAFERIIHFLYVFLPVIHMIFIHKILNIKRNYLIIISVIFSLLLSLSTFTEYYIQGLYKYKWGYIAKGGIAFQLFGVYGFLVLIYLLFCLFANLKRETDSIKRLSNSYMILSFAVLGFLTILNLPAINGIDLYPAGNFSFIPLAFLAYGILRYRMLDIRSFLHITVVRSFSFIIFLLPNWIVFYYARPFFPKIENVLLFFIFVIWFFANYMYLTRVQAKLDNKFYRMKYRLKLAEADFGETIRQISDFHMIIEKIRLTLKEALQFDSVTVFKRTIFDSPLIGPLGYKIEVGSKIDTSLFHGNNLVDRNMIETDLHYAGVRENVLKTFNSLQSAYMVPLFQDTELITLFFLSGTSYVKITQDEIDFTNNILKSASLKLSSLLVLND